MMSQGESFKIILSFIKWVFLGGVVGLLTGAAGAFFLKKFRVCYRNTYEYSMDYIFLPFGGSTGREGTGVQIGASIAERMGKNFDLDKEDSKVILMEGISGGFSSVFGTPIASTIFGMEVATLGSMNYISMELYLYLRFV